jgi:hypothetical protein
MRNLGSLPAPLPVAASFPILLFWFGLALGVGCRPLTAVHFHGSRGGHADDGGSPSYGEVVKPEISGNSGSPWPPEFSDLWLASWRQLVSLVSILDV